jgi:hypothetical protein
MPYHKLYKNVSLEKLRLAVQQIGDVANKPYCTNIYILVCWCPATQAG